MATTIIDLCNEIQKRGLDDEWNRFHEAQMWNVTDGLVPALQAFIFAYDVGRRVAEQGQVKVG